MFVHQRYASIVSNPENRVFTLDDVSHALQADSITWLKPTPQHFHGLNSQLIPVIMKSSLNQRAWRQQVSGAMTCADFGNLPLGIMK